MTETVIEMEARRTPRPAGNDFWFAQVDLRLTRIETVVERLERMLWMLVYAGGAILALEALRALVMA